MILKILVPVVVAVLYLITFASSGSSNSKSDNRNTSFETSFEDDINSVRDDLYSIGNDTSDTGSDLPSLASDLESLQDDFGPLVQCHQLHPFPFQDCYREISVKTTKSQGDFTNKEFKDYKCELMSALGECLVLKTRIYCGNADDDLVKALFSIFKPQYEFECNQTGIIKSHLVQFSV
nr:uncharacterized protein LOC107440154 [Parasteatoda tepidariorum]